MSTRDAVQPTGFVGLLHLIGQAMLLPFSVVQTAHSQASAYDRLAHMSDAELEARGLTRGEILEEVVLRGNPRAF